MTISSTEDKSPSPPRRWVGILFGFLLLITYAIPWGVYGGRLQWARMLFQTGKPNATRAMLVGLWIIGGLTLVASGAGIQLAVVYLIVGIAALALFLVGTGCSTAPWHILLNFPLENRFTVFAGVIVLGTFLVVSRMRARSMGAMAPIPTIQRLAAALLAIVVCISMLGEIRSAHLPANSMQSPACGIGVSCVAGWLALMGCGLAYYDGRSAGAISRPAASLACRLVLTGLSLKILWGVFGSATTGLNAGAVFRQLNNNLLLVGMSMLAVEGISGAIRINGAKHGPIQLGSAGRKPPSRIFPRLVAPILCAALVAALAFGAAKSAPNKKSTLAWVPPARGSDWPQWCGGPDHNMVSNEHGLPADFDEASNSNTSDLKNVKWVVRLSNTTLGSPIIHNGRVFIGGTGQNGGGILWCFAEADGKLLWRMKLPFIANLYNESFGICSTPAAEGDKIYALTHLGDVLCLSADGMRGGNRGPFTDEANYLATGRRLIKADLSPDGSRLLDISPGEPITLGEYDPDIIWRFDMLRQTNCWPYNAVNSGIVIRGDNLFLATSSVYTTNQDGSAAAINQWKSRSGKTSYPSPALIVLNKKTGKLVAAEAEGIFDKTFHGANSSPAIGMVNGKELLIYCGGNGTCYAFDPNFTPSSDGKPAPLKLIWKFDCTDPASYASGFSAERPTKSEIIASPVIYKDRIYISIGNDLTNSGKASYPGRLVCIDATQTGDVTRSARLWSFDEMRSSSSTVAIADGLLYTADASGVIYCLDAETGQPYWTHSSNIVWASPLVADGKVYVPTNDEGLLVFAHSREKKLLAHSMGNKRINSSPAAANGVLYIASQRYLYALRQGSHGNLVPHDD